MIAYGTTRPTPRPKSSQVCSTPPVQQGPDFLKVVLYALLATAVFYLATS